MAPRLTSSWLLLAAAAYFGLTYVVLDGGFLINRFFSLGIRAGEVISWTEFASKRLIFLTVHVIAVGSLVCLSLSRWRAFSIPVLAILFAITVFDLTYFLASGRFANLSDVAVLLEAVGHTPEALKEHRAPTLQALLLATVTFVPLVGVALFHQRVGTYRGFGRLGLSGIGALFAVYCALAATKGEAGLAGFPRGYSSLFAAALVGIDRPQARDTHFEYLQAVAPQHGMKKIIVIMDESIVSAVFRAQLLGQALPNAYVHPGIVFSGANISAASNYYFRKAGLVPERGVVQVASLFEQARAAGYRTVYIDNQGVLSDPGARNYMDSTEMNSVSQVIENDKLLRHERDAASLGQLDRILRDDAATFVYVNKLGSHIPYETTIAPDWRSGDRREDYRRSVRINAVEYLARLMPMVGPDAVVIYTSDHGQDLKGGFAHGNPGEEASIIEWEVPFVVGSGNVDFMRSLSASPTLRSSYLSHFDIAELVRNLLGYSLSGSLQVLAKSGNPRTAREYCAYYGPPHAVLGPSSGPKCRVWSADDIMLAGAPEASVASPGNPRASTSAAAGAPTPSGGTSGDAILFSSSDSFVSKASNIDAEAWLPIAQPLRLH